MSPTWHGTTPADLERIAARIKDSARKVHPLGKPETNLPSLRGPRSEMGVNGGRTAEQDKAARLERQRKKRAQSVKRNVARKAKRAKDAVYKTSAGEAMLIQQMGLAGIKDWVREYRFLPDRLFRLDFAWPKIKLAVEVDGGTFIGGRHVRGTGFAKDCEKFNLAALAGWRFLRYTTEMLKSGIAVQQITDMLIGLQMASANGLQNLGEGGQAARGDALAESSRIAISAKQAPQKGVYVDSGSILPPEWGKVR